MRGGEVYRVYIVHYTGTPDTGINIYIESGEFGRNQPTRKKKSLLRLNISKIIFLPIERKRGESVYSMCIYIRAGRKMKILMYYSQYHRGYLIDITVVSTQ